MEYLKMLDKSLFIVYDINNILNAVTGNPHTISCFRELSVGASQQKRALNWPRSPFSETFS